MDMDGNHLDVTDRADTNANIYLLPTLQRARFHFYWIKFLHALCTYSTEDNADRKTNNVISFPFNGSLLFLMSTWSGIRHCDLVVHRSWRQVPLHVSYLISISKRSQRDKSPFYQDTNKRLSLAGCRSTDSPLSHGHRCSLQRSSTLVATTTTLNTRLDILFIIKEESFFFFLYHSSV